MESEKTTPIEIELADFSKEDLIAILVAMHERDLTFNEFIVASLEAMIDQYKEIPDTETVLVHSEEEGGIIRTAIEENI